jgi:hypothetical protein
MRMTLEIYSAAELEILLQAIRLLELNSQAEDDRKLDSVEKVAIAAEEQAKKPAKKQKKEAAPEPAEAPAASSPEADVPFELVTLQDVKKILRDLPGAREKAKAALEQLGKERISDLSEKELAAFVVSLGVVEPVAA